MVSGGENHKSLLDSIDKERDVLCLFFPHPFLVLARGKKKERNAAVGYPQITDGRDSWICVSVCSFVTVYTVKIFFPLNLFILYFIYIDERLNFFQHNQSNISSVKIYVSCVLCT